MKLLEKIINNKEIINKLNEESENKKLNKYLLGGLLVILVIFIMYCEFKEAKTDISKRNIQGYTYVDEMGNQIDEYTTKDGSIKRFIRFTDGKIEKIETPSRRNHIRKIIRAGRDGILKGALAGGITGGPIGAMSGGIAMGTVSMFMTGASEFTSHK